MGFTVQKNNSKKEQLTLRNGARQLGEGGLTGKRQLLAWMAPSMRPWDSES